MFWLHCGFYGANYDKSKGQNTEIDIIGGGVVKTVSCSVDVFNPKHNFFIQSQVIELLTLTACRQFCGMIVTE